MILIAGKTCCKKASLVFVLIVCPVAKRILFCFFKISTVVGVLSFPGEGLAAMDILVIVDGKLFSRAASKQPAKGLFCDISFGVKRILVIEQRVRFVIEVCSSKQPSLVIPFSPDIMLAEKTLSVSIVFSLPCGAAFGIPDIRRYRSVGLLGMCLAMGFPIAIGKLMRYFWLKTNKLLCP